MIWERQEGETPNQYCWFQEFLQHNDYSLKNFHEQVSKNATEMEQESQKKIKTPKYSTIQKWSSYNNWMKRKEAYTIYKSEQQTHRLEEAEYKNKERIHQKKNVLITKALTKVEEEFDRGTLSGYQWSNWINGIAKLLDDNRIDLGKATSITRNKSEVHVEQELDVNSVFERVDEALADIKDEQKC